MLSATKNSSENEAFMMARCGLYVLLFAVVCSPGFPFQRTMSVADVAQAVRPSVVVITTRDQDGKALAQGSGFIVAPDGLIATNVHVIDGAYAASVELASGDIYDSVWVTDFDQRRDLALIRIKALNLRSLSLGDSDKLTVGQHIIAVGNPSGLTETVSDGILSALRQVEGFKLLQITTPVSPGSSGGPVLNDMGEVVGVAQATMEGQNLNFAVPINYLKPLIASSDGSKPIPLAEFNAGRLKSASTSSNAEEPKPATDTPSPLDGAWSATISDAKTSASLQFNLIQNDEGEVVGTYTTSLGGGGSIKGEINDGLFTFELTQSIQGCPGIFKGTAEMGVGKASGSYTGTDCLGDHGKGTFTMTRGAQVASASVRTQEAPQKVPIVNGEFRELRGVRYIFVVADKNPAAKTEIAQQLTKAGLGVVTDVRQAQAGLIFLIQYSSEGQLAVAEVSGQALRPNGSGGLRLVWSYTDRLVRPSMNERDIAKSFTKAFLKAYKRANR